VCANDLGSAAALYGWLGAVDAKVKTMVDGRLKHHTIATRAPSTLPVAS